MARLEAQETLDPQAVRRFADDLKGTLIQPGDADYDEARRVWNGMIDRRPALVARCLGVEDIARSLAFAREHDLHVTVRGAAHNVGGRSVADGALMIDLRQMRWVKVDSGARTAHVGPGAVGADLDRETQAFGLATPGGTDSSTGVIGLTLGGGFGFLSRRFGLAADNLRGATVVLADGRVVQAAPDGDPDLLWALRGGGGRFGVVAEMELDLHPLGPELAVAQVFYPYRSASAALRFFRDFMAEAPDEVGSFALAVNVPPVDPFPQEHQGKTAIALVVAYAGETETGMRALHPLGEFGEPILNAITPMPYTALQQAFDAASPAGNRYFWKSQYLSGLPDEAIDLFVDRCRTLPGPFSAAWFEPLGGAFGRIDPGAAAFPHRQAVCNFAIQAGWTDAGDDARAIAWARSFHAAMAPFSTGGQYANYAGSDGDAELAALYGANAQRLQRLMATYDPDGVFSRR